ncbi:hypothetical protein [Lacticaseibacillus jixiensis]|uniref:hypothetical protein n=1 Tax=Lacticaseibacillus jixiensis TaxID=3231926 RepID=UPI0036F3F130
MQKTKKAKGKSRLKQAYLFAIFLLVLLLLYPSSRTFTSNNYNNATRSLQGDVSLILSESNLNELRQQVQDGQIQSTDVQHLETLRDKALQDAKSVDRISLSSSLYNLLLAKEQFSSMPKAPGIRSSLKYMVSHNLSYYAQSENKQPALNVFLTTIKRIGALILLPLVLMIALLLNSFSKPGENEINILVKTCSMTVISMLAIGVLTFAPWGVFNGLGAKYQNVFYSDLTEKFSYMTNSAIIVRYAAYLVLLVVFLVVLIKLLRKLPFGNVTGPVIGVVIATIGTTSLYQSHMYSSALRWLPTTYMNPYTMVTPNEASGLSLSTTTAIVVLLISVGILITADVIIAKHTQQRSIPTVLLG